LNAAAWRLAARLAIIPAAFALGGIVMRLLLRNAPAPAAGWLAQPLSVVTAWGALGAVAWTVLALTIALGAYGAIAVVRTLQTAELSPRIAFRLVLAAAFSALMAALTWPVVFSSDVYAYAAYGEEALRGLNPYAYPPPGVHSPYFSAAAWQWSGRFPVCVYGQAFVAYAALIVRATHGLGIAATLFTFRFKACFEYLIAAAALFFAWRPSNPRARLASFAGFALNPVGLWCAAEGHNDALMLAIALCGTLLACARTPIGGGLLVGLSALVKVPGIFPATVLGWLVLSFARVRAQRFGAGIVAGVAIALAVAAPRMLGLAHTLGEHARYAPQFSLQALAAAALAQLAPGAPPIAALALVFAGCTGVALYALYAIQRGERAGVAWLALAVWLAIPNPYPWYGLWVLPIAVLALGESAFGALWGVTIFAVVRYLPDAYGELAPDLSLAIAAVMLLPLLYALRPAHAIARSGEPALR
jgi:hypothetical protein